jgi:Tfp pilus assembly protein PilX
MKQKKSNAGFTLLVAIVTTSILLVVSYVIANVALKQLTISYSNQESQYAFYNAESGIECAIYLDLKIAGGSVFATSSGPVMYACGDTSLNLGENMGGGGDANATTTFTINFQKGCAVVKVAKVPTPVSSYGLTRIESYGYNNCTGGFGRKFERGITITY